MTKTITILEGQSTIDIAIREYGSVEGLIRLLIDNGLSVNSEIVAGQTLLIDSNNIVDRRVVNGFL